MKNTIFKSILALAMAFMALPMMGQDYLSIYFKDGHRERHFMHLVKEITTSKYDLDGNLHSDYQLQQIVMADTTYSYYFADIDSMTFRKVDEEIVKKDIETVIISADSILQYCKTVEEIQHHLDEIEKIEGVEYAKLIPLGIVVQIRDSYKIYYYILPEPIDDDEQQNSKPKLLPPKDKMNKAITTLTDSEKPIKIALANAFHNDLLRINQTTELLNLDQELKAFGFDSNYFDYLDLSFFANTINEYDHVILFSHGTYDPDPVEHNIVTNVDLEKGYLNEYLSEQVENGVINVNDYDIDDFSYGITEGVFGGRFYHLAISEKFIQKRISNRKHNSPSIFFSGACESLKGHDYIDRNVEPFTVLGNKLMSNAFINKENGFDIYIGYNNSNIMGILGGVNLFRNMLNGESEEVAFANILPIYLYDHSLPFLHAYLIDVCKDSDSDASPRKKFIVKTKTKDLSPLDVTYFAVNGKIRITGYTTMNNPLLSPVICGFWYNIDGENYPLLQCSKEYNLLDLKEDNVSFSATIDIKKGQKIKYRAFTYDGVNYNWGEEREFIDYDELSLSTNSVFLKVGETSTVDITAGNGSYSIEKINPEGVVSATISGNSITLEALTAGTAIITVKDNKSGETATIEVTVSVHESSIQTETFTVNGVSFKMVAVEGGTFIMGAPSTDNDAKDYEKPQHQVTLDSYAIGETEVTQELWKAVMGSNPSYFGGSNQCPVEQVSWYDCRTFINKLNKLTGKKFRLPTEAEWEFAARGGKNSQGYTYSGSNNPNDVAWYDVNSENRTHPVATKAANELGLYDMSGNVWEWCQDFYGDFSTNSQMNPTGPDTGTDLVLRSGSWNFPNFFCRSWHRNHDTPDHKASHLGLRLALSDSDIHNQCPARIVGVELTSTEYHRDKTYPNEMFFTVEAELDDLNDVEEWGVYFDDRPGKLLFPFETVDNSQTIGLYYNGKEGLMKVDIYSYVAQLEDEVGTYVKKRDKSTGKLITIYGDKYSFLLRYDNKPSMIISNPVITNTEFTGYDEDGEKKYKTTITYQYELNGAFWISYVNSGVSGGTWFFDETNDFLWYPEKDGSGEAIWIATYSCKGETINHTNWRILHLRNNQTVNSNYVNFTGDETITNAWVSSTPQFAPIGGQGNQLKTAGATSRCVMSHFISDEMGKGTFIPKKTKKEFPYKGGVIGIYHH